ncbi:MAG: tetratricopeptide repeat protein, partial [Thermoproteota archaeon]|nr:tetratricopeptide repeat protein [Thermoproteota archaeon]
MNGLDKSRKNYNKIINEIDRDHLDELYNKGVDFLEDEEYRKALGMFRKVLTLNPNDAEVWSCIGEILGRLGKYKKSLESLNKSLDIQPDNVEAINNK